MGTGLAADNPAPRGSRSSCSVPILSRWPLGTACPVRGGRAGRRAPPSHGPGGSALSASIPTGAPHFWGIVSLHGWPEPLGLGPAAWLVPALGRAVATRMPACLSRPSGVRNTINCRGRGPGLRKRLTARCQHAGQLSSSAECLPARNVVAPINSP